MRNRLKIFFQKDIVGNILLYVGFTVFLITWPISGIIIKNDSFRVVSGWTFYSFFIFFLLFSFLPSFLFIGLHYIVKTYKRENLFKTVIILLGAGVFWMQLAEYHLVPFVRISGFVTSRLRYWGLYWLFSFAGLFFLFLIYKWKKYIFNFLKYASILMVIAIGLVFSETAQTEMFYHSKIDSKIFADNQKLSSENVYLLVFDGVSLTSLVKRGEINKDFFPNFYRISKEWTWYRNATSNGASTTPSKSMMLSGRYYSKKIMSLGGFENTILLKIKPVSEIHLFLNDIVFQKDMPVGFLENINHALWLNKSIFYSYLDISITPPLDRYILKYFSSWKFDWQGKVPKEFSGKEYLYHGLNHQKQFANFEQEVLNSSKKGNFFFLWSVITHSPFIYDEKGNISEKPKFHTFEVGMSDQEIKKVSQNYIKTLQYADFLLGKFIKDLKKKGIYKEAVVILLSDHGFSKTGTNYDINPDVYRIPFFVKSSEIPPGTNDRDVQTLDVAPTIADIFGLSYSEYDGQSLLRDYKKRDKVIFVLGSTRSWKIENNPDWWLNQ